MITSYKYHQIIKLPFLIHFFLVCTVCTAKTSFLVLDLLFRVLEIAIILELSVLSFSDNLVGYIERIEASALIAEHVVLPTYRCVT